MEPVSEPVGGSLGGRAVDGADEQRGPFMARGQVRVDDTLQPFAIGRIGDGEERQLGPVRNELHGVGRQRAADERDCLDAARLGDELERNLAGRASADDRNVTTRRKFGERRLSFVWCHGEPVDLAPAQGVFQWKPEEGSVRLDRHDDGQPGHFVYSIRPYGVGREGRHRHRRWARPRP